MRNVSDYSKMGTGDLKLELIELTAVLSSHYTDLAHALGEQQSDYLTAYAQSPGGSVSAKNREAQHYTLEWTRQIFEARANINSLVLARDLLVLLLNGTPPNPVPFPEIGRLDEDACSVV